MGMERAGWRLIFLCVLLTAAGCGGTGGEIVFPESVRENPSSAPSTAHTASPLTVNMATPADGSVGVPVDVAPDLPFSDRPLEPVLLTGPDGLVATEFKTSPAGEVKLIPSAPLLPGTDYRVVIPAGTRGEHGGVLAATRAFGFRTASAPDQPQLTPLPPVRDGDGWVVGVRVAPAHGATTLSVTTDGATPEAPWTVTRATSLFAPASADTPGNVSARADWGGGELRFDSAIGWTETAALPLPPLADVAMTSRLDGWIADLDGGLWQTSDGGVSWNPAHAGAAPLNALAFATPWDGWAVGDGTVLTTTDGDTWNPVAIPSGANLLDVTTVGTDVVWAVGTGGAVLKGGIGIDWELVPTPTTRTLNAIACADRDHCLAVGERGTVIHTGDGGLTWRRMEPGTGADLLGAHLDRLGYGWIVGEGGVVITGGVTSGWVVRGASGQPWLGAVAFSGSDHGWFLGHGDVALATTNGGLTWRTQRLPRTLAIAAMDAVDARQLVAVGTDPVTGQGVILRTQTGGIF